MVYWAYRALCLACGQNGKNRHRCSRCNFWTVRLRTATRKRKHRLYWNLASAVKLLYLDTIWVNPAERVRAIFTSESVVLPKVMRSSVIHIFIFASGSSMGHELTPHRLLSYQNSVIELTEEGHSGCISMNRLLLFRSQISYLYIGESRAARLMRALYSNTSFLSFSFLYSNPYLPVLPSAYLFRISFIFASV